MATATEQTQATTTEDKTVAPVTEALPVTAAAGDTASILPADAAVEAPVSTVINEAEKVLEEIKQQFEGAENYIKRLLLQCKVTPRLAGKMQVPLPVEKVKFFTGAKDGQSTLDLRIDITNLNIIGEKIAIQAALDVLSKIPLLAENFNFDPSKADPSKPSVIGFSWTQDLKSVDIKFAFPNGLETADLVEHLTTMSKGAELAMGSSATSAETNMLSSGSSNITSVPPMPVPGTPNADTTVKLPTSVREVAKPAENAVDRLNKPSTAAAMTP